MKRRAEAPDSAIIQLAEILAKIDSAADMQDFLTDLLTPAELEAMADRWQVVPLLKSGQSYRAVHAATGVSVTTIGRVARHLAAGAGGYEKALQL